MRPVAEAKNAAPQNSAQLFCEMTSYYFLVLFLLVFVGLCWSASDFQLPVLLCEPCLFVVHSSHSAHYVGTWPCEVPNIPGHHQDISEELLGTAQDAWSSTTHHSTKHRLQGHASIRFSVELFFKATATGDLGDPRTAPQALCTQGLH